MDMMMDIAALGMSMKAAQTQQSVDIALLKNTMDQQTEAMDQLMRQMASAASGLGMNLDTYA